MNTVSNTVPKALPQSEKRRNFILGVANGALFEVAVAFLGFSTVIPVYLSNLTDTGWVIGFASTIPMAGWLLPQLFLARIWENRPYKKPLYLLGTTVRLSMLLAAISVVYFLSTAAPRLALLLFLLFLSLYSIGAGFCGLPFMEIVSKTIPSHQRSRFFSTRFFLGNIGAFFSGIAIRWFLSQPDLFPYPANYAFIFFISWSAMAMGLGSFLLIREPKDERDETSPPLSFTAYLRASVSVLSRDRRYVRYLTFRLFMAGVPLSMPFYARHAITQLGAPDALVGIFVASQTIGAILSNIGWGLLGDRAGKHLVLRTSAALALLVPTLALTASLITKTAGPTIGTWAFITMFPIIGAALNGDFIGNNSYLLDIAPDEKRSTYIGFTNTFGAVMSFLPILGGLIADLTSYPVVFTASLVMLALANLAAWRLAPVGK